MTKTTELGKFDVGATTGSSSAVEATYIKVDINKKTVLEIDKYGYKSQVGDTDYLSEVREALGIE